MVGSKLVCHFSSNDSWHFVIPHTNWVKGDTPWTYPGPLDSMPWHLRGSDCFTPYWNLTVTDHVQFCNSNHSRISMYLICGINFISVTIILLGAVLFTSSSMYTCIAMEHPRLLFFYVPKLIKMPMSNIPLNLTIVSSISHIPFK